MQELKLLVTRQLHLVKPKPYQTKEPHEPSPLEILTGWRKVEDYDGRELLVNEGDHNLFVEPRPNKDFIFRWRPDPGDTVVATFSVQFECTGHATDKGEVLYSPRQAAITPVIHTKLGPPILVVARWLKRPESIAERRQDGFRQALKTALQEGTHEAPDIRVEAEFIDLSKPNRPEDAYTPIVVRKD